MTCYYGGTAAYASCSAYSSSYRSSYGNYCGASSTTIKTGIGGSCVNTTCYYGGTAAYASCSAYSSSYSASKSSSKCGQSSTTIKGNPGGSCTNLTCYYGGSNVCSETTYPYASGTTISNGSLSGLTCTGYRSTGGGTCSGSSATYYSSVKCNSGYCFQSGPTLIEGGLILQSANVKTTMGVNPSAALLTGPSCVKAYASCTAAGYKASVPSGQTCTTVYVKKTDCSTQLTCYTNCATAYNCASNQTTLQKYSTSLRYAYAACCGGTTYCRTAAQCTTSTKPGSYSDGCVPLTTQLVGETSPQKNCQSTMTYYANKIAEHNAKCPSNKVTDYTSTSRCNTYYQNGMAAMVNYDFTGCSSSSSSSGLLPLL